MEHYYELEEMRGQLAALKKKIADQDIVNDRLIRKAVANKMTGIHRHRNKVIILGIIALAINIPYIYYMDFSLYLLAYTVFMILFSMYTTCKSHLAVENSDVMNGDLLSTAKDLKTLKKKYNRSYFYSIPMVLVYIVWVIYEISLQYDPHYAKPIVVGLLVGGLVGAAWGVSMNLKLVRMCDDIIAEIEE